MVTGTSPPDLGPRRLGHPVTATANTGYHFVDWSDGVPTTRHRHPNVTGNISVTANFRDQHLSLTYIAASGGTIPSVTRHRASTTGHRTAVTAMPDVGVHFVGWSDGRTDNPRIDAKCDAADVVVTAYFRDRRLPSVLHRRGRAAFVTGVGGPRTRPTAARAPPVTGHRQHRLPTSWTGRTGVPTTRAPTQRDRRHQRDRQLRDQTPIRSPNIAASGGDHPR